MPIKYSVLVDTCVATAIGQPTVPSMATALRIVNELTKGDVGLAMTSELRREWREHASRYMKSFLARMQSRRRVADFPNKRVADFRNSLEMLENEGKRRAVEKDAHLTEVAILLRLPIISLDDKQRGYLVGLSEHYSTLLVIQWFNPQSEGDLCHAWLRLSPHDRNVATLAQYKENMK